MKIPAALILLALLASAGTGRAQNPEVPLAELADPAAVAPGESEAEETPAGPQLVEVSYEDRVYFREQTLAGFLRHPVPGPLDEKMLEADRALIQSRYRDRGYLSAVVGLRLEGALNSRRAIFEIQAGDRAELKAIHVNGNAAISDADLREGFFSRPPELLGALTRAGLFHKPFLDQDAQRLVANYYKRGYLEARVLRTRVVANANADGLEVTLDVFEGAVYELSGITYVGDLPEGSTTESLREQVSIEDGDVADLLAVQQESDKLLDALREEGHAFARLEQGVQVTAPPSGDETRRGIALTLRMVKGPVSTVRKVRIEGPHGTLDHVIMRDVPVKEGETYRHSELKRAQEQLQATGFFQQVVVRPAPVPGEPELVDVVITVKEQQTWVGSIAPTAGGQGEDIVGILVLADRNLFGSGLYGAINGLFSARRQTFDAQLIEPRLLGTRMTLGAEVHRREVTYFSRAALQNGRPDFRLRTEGGGGVNFSAPVGLGFVASTSATVEMVGVIRDGPRNQLHSEGFTGANLNPLARDAADRVGQHIQRSVPDVAESDLFPGTACTLVDPEDFLGGLSCGAVFRNVLSAGVAWDKRDSRLLPKNGAYVSLGVSYGGPLTLSRVEALRTTGNLQLFWTPLWSLTLKSNTEVGYVFNPHGGGVAVTDRFFLGGFSSLRGYFPGSVGPVRAVPNVERGSTLVGVGGALKVLQNTAIEFPLVPEMPVRGFFFFDAGNAFGEDEPWFTSDLLAERGPVELPFDLGRSQRVLGLHMSVGVGVVLDTPALPLSVNIGLPLQKRALDRDFDFFLGFGSGF
jgi:outer membrane protein insertion porin family